MINRRPTALLSGQFYRSLPRLPLGIDQSYLPDLLKLDLFDLVGLLPITTDICALSPDGMLDVQPSEKMIRYFQEQNIQFAMISIVANCYHFEESDGLLKGRPYSYTLFPASKRGAVDYSDAQIFSIINYEKLPAQGCVYYDFDPFAGDWGLFGPYGLGGGSEAVQNTFTDSIGFVVGTYFLANTFDEYKVALPDLVDASPAIRKRYRRWRIRRYFGHFDDVRPRRIWGAESALELFLMQGLAAEGIHGVPQYLFFSNGETFPSFHNMVQDDSFASETPLITDADMYFPDQRVAVFCDSRRFHRLGAVRLKDRNVVSKLAAMGIRSVRISESLILEDMPRAVEMVKVALRSPKI